MSAAEWSALTPNSLSIPRRMASISAASPKPLRRTFAPCPARARAIASPIPLVEPVTRAALDWSIMRDLEKTSGERGRV
jgi:hypothetical protein